MVFIDIIKKLFVLGNVLSGIVALGLIEAGSAGLFIFFKYYPGVRIFRDISIALILLGVIAMVVNGAGGIGASFNIRFILLTYLICLGVAIAVEVCVAGLTFGGVFNIKKHVEVWTTDSTLGVTAGLFARIINCSLEMDSENNCVDVYVKPVGRVLIGLLVLVQLAGCVSSFFLWKVFGSRQRAANMKSNSIELN